MRKGKLFFEEDLWEDLSRMEAVSRVNTILSEREDTDSSDYSDIVIEMDVLGMYTVRVKKFVKVEWDEVEP